MFKKINYKQSSAAVLVLCLFVFLPLFINDLYDQKPLQEKTERERNLREIKKYAVK